MNTPSEDAVENGKQRRRSEGSGGGGGGSRLAGGKTRRNSIGVTSSRKSIGEEGNIVPNYLRASTGSCHDFCKYGKKHEDSTSSVPINFKTTRSVNGDKFTKGIVSMEKKKTTLNASMNLEMLKPAQPDKVTKKVGSLPSKKPQVLKQSSSTNGNETKNEVSTLQRSHDGIKKVDVKTVKKTGVTPKTGLVKKVTPKATLNESQSSKGSFTRAASLKTVNSRGVKHVSPLKDQNRVQNAEPKQTIDENVHTKILDSVEAEPEVKPEAMEFDLIQSSMESTSDPVSNSSESFSGKKIVDEESMITNLVHESSDILSDKDYLVTAPAVVESLQSCSDEDVLEEESLIARPVSESSESFYDDEVLEGESDYTDDEEVEVSEDGSETADNDINEMETSVGTQNKIPRKARTVISDDKDEKAVKLRFRRGRILDLQSENNGPRRLKFRRRVVEGNEDGQSIARISYKNKTLDVQTEVNGPRKLSFTKAKEPEGNEQKQRVSRRSFERKYVEENQDSINGPENVVLKHQGEQGKKDAQGLFNNVIEETASKLVESRKSKVKALVGAFETVISLQDGKPAST